jgi:acyl-CoA reductase-like NAD-dependent aldehyde dehydrogenase
MNRPLIINGQAIAGSVSLTVLDKYTLEPFAHVTRADASLVDQAVAAAERAFCGPEIPPYRRYEILMKAAELMDGRRDAIIDDMIGESGFTRIDCQNDFDRCRQTLRLSAEEAKRITGELIPLQGAPGQDWRRIGFTMRFPVGVVVAITPFNSPLNTVAHKIAPALAAGNSVVLKPSSYTPLSALALVEILHEAGLPPGWLNIVVGGGSDVGDQLLRDQRVAYYTFTGSTGVGRELQRHAGLRRTQLELGNISAVIICDDAALDFAISKAIPATFRKAGQVCTSVQRIYVARSQFDTFAQKLVDKAKEIPVGDPRIETTVTGPMIAMKEADRASLWVEEAKRAGASALLEGGRDRAVVWPTILTNVKPTMKVLSEEIFAPVVSLLPFDTLDEAVDAANATPFGLAGGVFTNDVTRALELSRRLRMGTVHINDTSSNRVDLMPYGGVKESGFGQEGPKYAIRDMTEERLITWNPVLS